MAEDREEESGDVAKIVSLDRAGKSLKKVPPAANADEEYAVTLNLNHNEISTFEGMQTYGSLSRVSSKAGILFSDIRFIIPS